MNTCAIRPTRRDGRSPTRIRRAYLYIFLNIFVIRDLTFKSPRRQTRPLVPAPRACRVISLWLHVGARVRYTRVIIIIIIITIHARAIFRAQNVCCTTTRSNDFFRENNYFLIGYKAGRCVCARRRFRLRRKTKLKKPLVIYYTCIIDVHARAYHEYNDIV